MSVRNPLTNRRRQTSLTLSIPEMPKVNVGIGYYDREPGETVDRVGEVFVTTTKVGSAFDMECADSAVLLSFALQHGAQPEAIYDALHRTHDGKPATVMGHILQLIVEGDV